MTATIELDSVLHDEIKDFCLINKIEEKDFLSGLIRKYFLVEKYGDLNQKNNTVVPDNRDQEIEELKRKLSDSESRRKDLEKTLVNLKGELIKFKRDD